MKFALIIIVALLAFTTPFASIAQAPPPVTKSGLVDIEDNGYYVRAFKMPEYKKGGEAGLKKHIDKKLEYPATKEPLFEKKTIYLLMFITNTGKVEKIKPINVSDASDPYLLAAQKACEGLGSFTPAETKTGEKVAFKKVIFVEFIPK